MKLRSFSIILSLVFTLAACGSRDMVTTSSSAQATGSTHQHPLVGTWMNSTGTEDLVIRSNGSTFSQACGSTGNIGDVDASPQNECGPNSKSCGSFPFIIANANMGPNCLEAGSYICYYNVYTSSGHDTLAINCTDGKGISYFQKK